MDVRGLEPPFRASPSFRDVVHLVHAPKKKNSGGACFEPHSIESCYGLPALICIVALHAANRGFPLLFRGILYCDSRELHPSTLRLFRESMCFTVVLISHGYYAHFRHYPFSLAKLESPTADGSRTHSCPLGAVLPLHYKQLSDIVNAGTSTLRIRRYLFPPPQSAGRTYRRGSCQGAGKGPVLHSTREYYV